MSSPVPVPRSCDTFVFVGGETKGSPPPGHTLFGKNSDRPSEEEHQVVVFPARNSYSEGSMVNCTHIQIPQSTKGTYCVILSRPVWMWGCEMGANEHGVVGGNEAVNTQLAYELGNELRLTGMDLLRLSLERGRTALEAMKVCVSLLEEYGQGGPCEKGELFVKYFVQFNLPRSEIYVLVGACVDVGGTWTYENGFIFADGSEAFILETAGVKNWAVERVNPGSGRNISNGLSIRTEIHSLSPDIKSICINNGWWDGKSKFDWKLSVGSGGRASHCQLEVAGRELAGTKHLAEMGKLAEEGNLGENKPSDWMAGMAKILRDEGSGICFRDVDGFCSTGSQISWLVSETASSFPTGKVGTTTHLFTAASDPILTSYKPYTFPIDSFDGKGGVKQEDDFDSLVLWNLWRGVALADYSSESIYKGIKNTPKWNVVADVLKNNERASLQTADGIVVSGLSLKKAIKEEIEAIKSCLD